MGTGGMSPQTQGTVTFLDSPLRQWNPRFWGTCQLFPAFVSISEVRHDQPAIDSAPPAAVAAACGSRDRRADDLDVCPGHSWRPSSREWLAEADGTRSVHRDA